MMSPKVLAFHPEINIERNGERHILKLTLPDWEMEPEILSHLARKLGVRTVGELVTKLKTREGTQTVAEAIPDVEVHGVEVKPQAVCLCKEEVERKGQKVWGWDEPLV